MTKRVVSGNEAVALAALAAGAQVICGYPGTPSSEAIAGLLRLSEKELAGTYVEWSVNEKVAVEIAATCAWAGKRALCTMKMSGMNVAYDSLIGIVHSGVIGGMVVYVCDDPGVTAGMVEQDSRGFALMADATLLEPGTVAESYQMTKYAFELSEKIQAPVFVRSVTNVAQSHGAVEIEPGQAPPDFIPVVKRDINKYAKAGAAMCMAQHGDAIAALAKAGEILRHDGLHQLTLAAKPGGFGIIAVGIAKCYVEEALEIAAKQGLTLGEVSILKAAGTLPYPQEELRTILKHCSKVLVVEELEPYLEREVYVQSQMLGLQTKIAGKLSGELSRIGSYNGLTVAAALCAAHGHPFDQELLNRGQESFAKALTRPITCCAGCPHRGTYLAINQTIKNAGLKKEQVIVTGDIGCTILGMNPPFDTIWMEISMGASIPCAQGFALSGVDKPIFATLGDSTFLHGGIPGLINAVQHDIDITVIIMDNGWTAMTGMQVNPNTAQEFQRKPARHLDLLHIVEGVGVEHIFVVDPFDQQQTIGALEKCLSLKGVKVVVARRECAIQSNRRGQKYAKMRIDEEKCINCKLCFKISGCPAIIGGEKTVSFDESVCNGCGLCEETCPKQAIIREVL